MINNPTTSLELKYSSEARVVFLPDGVYQYKINFHQKIENGSEALSYILVNIKLSEDRKSISRMSLLFDPRFASLFGLYLDPNISHIQIENQLAKFDFKTNKAKIIKPYFDALTRSNGDSKQAAFENLIGEFKKQLLAEAGKYFVRGEEVRIPNFLGFIALYDPNARGGHHIAMLKSQYLYLTFEMAMQINSKLAESGLKTGAELTTIVSRRNEQNLQMLSSSQWEIFSLSKIYTIDLFSLALEIGHLGEHKWSFEAFLECAISAPEITDLLYGAFENAKRSTLSQHFERKDELLGGLDDLVDCLIRNLNEVSIEISRKLIENQKLHREVLEGRKNIEQKFANQSKILEIKAHNLAISSLKKSEKKTTSDAFENELSSLEEEFQTAKKELEVRKASAERDMSELLVLEKNEITARIASAKKEFEIDIEQNNLGLTHIMVEISIRIFNLSRAFGKNGVLSDYSGSKPQAEALHEIFSKLSNFCFKNISTTRVERFPMDKLLNINSKKMFSTLVLALTEDMIGLIVLDNDKGREVIDKFKSDLKSEDISLIKTFLNQFLNGEFKENGAQRFVTNEESNPQSITDEPDIQIGDGEVTLTTNSSQIFFPKMVEYGVLREKLTRLSGLGSSEEIIEKFETSLRAKNESENLRRYLDSKNLLKDSKDQSFFVLEFWNSKFNLDLLSPKLLEALEQYANSSRDPSCVINFLNHIYTFLALNQSSSSYIYENAKEIYLLVHELRSSNIILNANNDPYHSGMLYSRKFNLSGIQVFCSPHPAILRAIYEKIKNSDISFLYKESLLDHISLRFNNKLSVFIREQLASNDLLYKDIFKGLEILERINALEGEFNEICKMTKIHQEASIQPQKNRIDSEIITLKQELKKLRSEYYESIKLINQKFSSDLNQIREMDLEEIETGKLPTAVQNQISEIEQKKTLFETEKYSELSEFDLEYFTEKAFFSIYHRKNFSVQEIRHGFHLKAPMAFLNKECRPKNEELSPKIQSNILILKNFDFKGKEKGYKIVVSDHELNSCWGNFGAVSGFSEVTIMTKSNPKFAKIDEIFKALEGKTNLSRSQTLEITLLVRQIFVDQQKGIKPIQETFEDLVSSPKESLEASSLVSKAQGNLK